MPDLARFHAARARVIAELHAGRKTSRRMGFIFPRLRQLGRSATALQYGIADVTEARTCLAGPILRTRLVKCATALLPHTGKTADAILGPIDAMKLRSSITLFALAGGAPVFTGALTAVHRGQPCPLTIAALPRR